MTPKTDSSMLAKVMVAVVVILSSMGLYSILLDLWRGEVVSTFERLFATLLILVLAGVFGLVIVQRIQMHKSEKFRREKW